MKRIIFVWLLIGVWGCQSQREEIVIINESSYSYIDYLTNKPFIVKSYTIINNSREPWLTWIDYDHQKKDIGNRDRAILRYFIRHHGDFNLMSLMTDDLVDYDNENPLIGRFFLAQINPTESFTYTFLFPNSISEISAIKQENIIVERRNKVVDIIGIPIKQEYLFNHNNIVLYSPQVEIE